MGPARPETPPSSHAAATQNVLSDNPDLSDILAGMEGPWIRAGERDLTAVVLGDPGRGFEAVGVVVFGAREEVALAVREGPFTGDGFVELAYPVRWDGEGCEVGVLRVDPGALVRVVVVGWDDLSEANKAGGG